VRYILLAAIAAVVLGMGVYLFIEVRSGSAQADVVTPAPSAPAPTVPAPTPTPAPKETAVARPAPVTSPTKHDSPSTPAPALEGTHEDETSSAAMGSANPKLDAVMDQANKAYDHQDFDEAKMIAGKVLARMPNNVRMLRIMVSSSCIDGDVAIAQKYYPNLPKFDREQMKVRCDRYGVTLTDPPQ
jgi:hypothetical protein